MPRTFSGAASKILQARCRFSSSSRIAATFPQRQQQLGADHTVTSRSRNMVLQPSMTSWWALQISVTLFLRLNCSTVSPPKMWPAPLLLFWKPSRPSSGSDHMRSQMGPSWGGSCLRWRDFISSMSLVSGPSPPCTQKMELSTRALSEIMSKTYMQYRQTLSEPYFRRHSSQKPQAWVIWRDSWLPRMRVTRLGQRTLRASSSRKVSTEWLPRSTKSPRNRQLLQGASPPILNSQSRSKICPWMSPQIIMGDCTFCTLPSSPRISFAFRHSAFTSCSCSFFTSFSCSIMWSRSPLPSTIIINLQQAIAINQWWKYRSRKWSQARLLAARFCSPSLRYCSRICLRSSSLASPLRPISARVYWHTSSRLRLIREVTCW